MRGRSLALALLLPLAVSAAGPAHETEPWEVEIRAFEAADRGDPPPAGGVLFVGSSSIRLWTTLAEDFPGERTINRGFGGSEIADATRLADRVVLPYRPRAIVLYAGDNDLANGKTPRRVRDDFVAFVVRVRHDLPGVCIGFITVKPSPARRHLLNAVRRANRLVRDYAAAQQGVAYLDVFTPMLDGEGEPRPELFVDDLLHLDRDGYALWISVIGPWLRDLPAASVSSPHSCP
ncbi:MAG: SGNH/GDSL hydrolase family protein [Thermoanaerobaculia bacterium]